VNAESRPALRRQLVASGPVSTRAAVAAVRADTPGLSPRGVLTAAEQLHRDLTGAGRLEPLLADPTVTDICVNGPGPVWVDTGGGLRRSGLVLDDPEELRALASRLAAAGGQRLDDAAPFADARLPSGIRVHAALPPLTPAGVHLSLRVPASRRFSLDALVRGGALPPDGRELLVGLVRSGAGFLVTGATGTGKTTMLSALLGHAAAGERIVMVEDSAELAPDHPHLVRLEARRPNAEGHGGIGLAELIRQALRMRPDRLVVGEARGAEVTDLLTALNTGHAGGCGTIHADRPVHLPARVEALASLSGWSRASAHSQLAAAVDAVVHLRRDPDGARRVAELALLDLRAGVVVATPAWDLSGGHAVAGPAARDWAQRCSRC